MLKVIELFGGIGACTEALKRIGIDFKVVDYVEIDKYAVASYNAINGTNFKCQDICSWNKDIEADLIMHGSPCQDFSIAGKQAGGDEGTGTRSSLMYETIRIVNKIKPKYVIWENVKNLLSKKHKHNFLKYIDKLNELGYKSYYQVLNSKNYGIPQNRDRIFVVSIKEDLNKNFSFPEPEELKLKLKDMLEDEVDEKYYLSDKMINYICANNEKWTGNNKESLINKTIASTINTGEGSKRCDASNYISNIASENYNLKQQLPDTLGIAVKDKKINKSLQETLEKNEIPDGINMIDGYNRNVRNDEISGTITTRVNASNNTYLAIRNATKGGVRNSYQRR